MNIIIKSGHNSCIMTTPLLHNSKILNFNVVTLIYITLNKENDFFGNVKFYLYFNNLERKKIKRLLLKLINWSK